MYTTSPVYCLILGGEALRSGFLAWSMDESIRNPRYPTAPVKSKIDHLPLALGDLS